MTLKVIGAGMGRTGTHSLKRALEILGFEPCYSVDEIPDHPDHVPIWINAAEGKPIEWDTLFADYQAALGMPTFAFYKDLMAHYPDAKVILTIRDPELWYKISSQHTSQNQAMAAVIYVMSRFVTKLKAFKAIEPITLKIGIDYIFDHKVPKEKAIRVFNDYNEEVQQIVPPEKLLVYDVKDAWTPLCEFLGVPVPDVPFPV